MESDDADLMEDGGNGVGISVSCSICFESVVDGGGRSRAKLQCGHEFHLDCIGSAFNVKGMMQCPNCRKIEKGQWLYASGSRSYPDFSMEDWTHDEDLYDLSYTDMPFHWCPFDVLPPRVTAPFEDGESVSTAYHELLGHHTIFAEHAASSSAAHSCPYVAYFQPVQPSSSNSNEGVSDVPNFNQHWNGLSGSSDISTSHTFTAVDLHYHTWEQPPPTFSPANNHFGGVDQASVPSGTLRSTRIDSDGQPRSGSFVHPIFLSHGSIPRAGNSIASPLVPPYPGSNSRRHDRAPGLHAYRQHSTPGVRSSMFSNVRRSSGPRTPVVPVASSSERTNGFYLFPSSGSSSRSVQEADNSVPNHLYAWERDRFAPFPLVPVDTESSWWGPFHQASGGLDTGGRSSSFWHRQGSERTSQSRSENPPFQASHPPGSMHRFL